MWTWILRNRNRLQEVGLAVFFYAFACFLFILTLFILPSCVQVYLDIVSEAPPAKRR